MTSIRDVARSVGVSTATVSRALRGLPRVSESTRDRVLRAAAELDYVASPSAAGLAGGRPRAVDVVEPSVSRWFFATVAQGAEAPLREAGYDLLPSQLPARSSPTWCRPVRGGTGWRRRMPAR